MCLLMLCILQNDVVLCDARFSTVGCIRMLTAQQPTLLLLLLVVPLASHVLSASELSWSKTLGINENAGFLDGSL